MKNFDSMQGSFRDSQLRDYFKKRDKDREESETVKMYCLFCGNETMHDLIDVDTWECRTCHTEQKVKGE